jgi:hypothetical protein
LEKKYFDPTTHTCIRTANLYDKQAQFDDIIAAIIKEREKGNANLSEDEELGVAESDSEYTQFTANCPVTADVEKSVWTDDACTGTFDNGQPLRFPSLVDMWSDPNPPTVLKDDWERVRDELHIKGKRLGGPTGSVGYLVYRASLALNLMQHRYTTDLFVLGGQCRLFLERTLGVFLPRRILRRILHGQKLDLKEQIWIMDQLGQKNLVNKEMVAACQKLREYGNWTVHDDRKELTLKDKPEVIKNVFIVAKQLILEIATVEEAREAGKY